MMPPTSKLRRATLAVMHTTIFNLDGGRPTAVSAAAQPVLRLFRTQGRNPMKSLTLTTSACIAVLLAGCQSDAQILAKEQDIARDAALRRGQFELNCPAATASVLSSVMLQPVAWRGTERAEYTIGVSGCDQKKTYVVVCPLDTSACFAASSR